MNQCVNNMSHAKEILYIKLKSNSFFIWVNQQILTSKYYAITSTFANDGEIKENVPLQKAD